MLQLPAANSEGYKDSSQLTAEDWSLTLVKCANMEPSNPVACSNDSGTSSVNTIDDVINDEEQENRHNNEDLRYLTIFRIINLAYTISNNILLLLL